MAEHRAAARSGFETFKGFLQPLLGEEMAVAVAEQDVRTPSGFPALFVFFPVAGAGGLRPVLEELLRARSLGIFEPGDALPTGYPYLVRRRAAGTWTYEMSIRNTRRHEGYRPAFAIVADDLVYCTSLDALEAFVAMDGKRPPSTGHPPEDDPWLALDGAEVLSLEWRTPDDLRPLRNAYDYYVELGRYTSRSAALALSDRTDYGELWEAARDALARVRWQMRVGVWEPEGVRVRARWRLSPGRR